MQVIELLCHGTAPFSHIHGLSDPELVSLLLTKQSIEFLILHLFSVLLVEENSCISLTSNRDLESFVTAFHVHVVRALPIVYNFLPTLLSRHCQRSTVEVHTLKLRWSDARFN